MTLEEKNSYLRKVITTKGDILYATTGGAATRLPIGGAGYRLRHKNGDGEPSWDQGERINVRDYGALGDGSDETSVIQSAVNAAAGATLFFPKPSSYYSISSALTVSDDTTIVLDPTSVIEQTTKYTPVFDINQVDGVTIQGNGALLRYTGTRTYTGGGSFRGGDDYTYGAGVYIAGNRTDVRNLRIEGFTEGVYCSGWDGAAQTNYQNTNNVVENIVVDDVDFGVLFTGQSDLTLRGIRGTSVLATTSPNPSHLIYGSNLARNRQVACSDCEAWDIADSFPFQFKGVDGGTIKNLTARNCSGLLSEGGSSGSFNTDLTFSNLSGRDLLTTAGSGAVFMQGSSLRVRITNLNLHLAASDRAIRLDGTDCAISNATVRTRHDSNSSSYSITVQGTRPTLDGIHLANLQDDNSDYTTGWRSINVTTSTDAMVRVLALKNIWQFGVDVAAGATNPKIDLSQAKITFVSGGTISPLTNASSTLRVIKGDDLVSADVGNAAKTLSVLVDDTTQRWNTALTANRAVTLSTTGAYRGAKFRIIREASATGAFTLDVGTGPLKSLGPSQWCDVEYDGSAWRLAAYGDHANTRQGDFTFQNTSFANRVVVDTVNSEFELRGGTDLRVFSDDGTTEKGSWDGATGNIQSDGTIQADTDFTIGANSIMVSAVNLIIDGGGSAITTGVKADISIPYKCTITANRLLADQSGSIVLDLWKDTYASFPPTVADTITASAKPTLSSATKSEDTTLTGWTTSVAAGDTIRVNVDSASTVTRVTLALTVKRAA